MKCLYSLILICLFLTVGSSCTSAKGYDTTDGNTISGITVGISCAEDVIKKHGKNFVIESNNYSTHIIYSDLGLTFTHKTNDKNKIIFYILAVAPYKLSTSNGIVLNKSSMKDVERVYKKLNWTTSDGNAYWGSDHNGIIFYVLRDKKLPQYPLNEELHINRVIKEIGLDSRYKR